MQMIDYALQYAGRGWRVFPLKPRGKTPLTQHGFKDASVSPSLIESWWRQWPDANVAIATGSASGLMVIDLDSIQAAKNFLAFIVQQTGNENFFDKNMVVVKTSRGYHLYFNILPGNVIKCSTGAKNTWEEGVDIRADGGYVAAPPSVHPDGTIYSWINYEKLAAEMGASSSSSSQNANS